MSVVSKFVSRRLPVAMVLGLVMSALVMVGTGVIARASGTTNVTCGDIPGLVTAINNANGNIDADTINITGAPCTFSLTVPSVNAGPNGNSTGLPLVTTPITILGHGATIERSAALPATTTFRILFANGANANLNLQDLTIKGGLLNSGFVGAGLAVFTSASMSLDHVTVTGNTTSGTNGAGAGLWAQGTSVTIDHSAFTSNTAPTSAALSLITTPATIRRSTFSGNVATSSTGVSWVQGNTVNFENDTFANNSSANGIGGITGSNSGATNGIVNVSNSTFADNGTGTTAPGGAMFRFLQTGGGTATINVSNTIVADTDSTATGGLAACTGVTSSGTGNIEWPFNTCGFGAGNQVNPNLTALANNGGSTNTMRPLPTSPAIDHASGTCPATDQRDVARPDGEACDSGAYETPAPATSASGTSGTTNNPQVTFSSPDTPTATFQCAVDAGAFATCTSPFSPSTTDGAHTVLVRAVDAQGYLDKTPASVALTVDKTAPVVTITPPTTPTPDDTPTISFSVNDGSPTTCQVDATTPVSCVSPYTTPSLTNGPHTIKVVATDVAGNAGSAQTTIVVDTAPGVTIPVTTCDVTALRNAVTTANSTFAADTIDITAGPCTFTLPNSVDPSAGGNGLPVVIHPLTVLGHGSTIARSTASGTPSFRIWFARGDLGDTNTSLELHDMTVQSGSVVGGNVGGGIAGLVAGIRLDKVLVFGNAAAAPGTGGGLWIQGGSLDIDHSAFDFNAAAIGGALITNGTPGSIRRSLFFGNGATNTTGAAFIQGSTVTFENDTIAGNAGASGVGGIAAVSPATVNVESSTLYNNRKTGVTAPGGALWAQTGSVIHVHNSIVTDDSTAAAAFPPCTPPITNDGGNIEWPGTTCGFGTNVNPQLGAFTALGNNGGYPLLPTSPAIDLGGATCPATDQFDVTRPDGIACDSGALEAPQPETVATGPASSPTNNPTITFSSPDTPTATFQCKVDSGTYATCTSPFMPVLSDGPHTVLVRAVAAGGYPDLTPASVTFTVDRTAPVVTITSAPPAVTADNTATVAFTVDDGSATVTCQVDGATPVACVSPFTTDPLADGTHTITVAATDPVGNVGSKSATFKVDTVPSQTLSVTCGDVAALRAAIATANATLAADTIDVTAGPCTFTLIDSVDPAAGGNGLPIVVHPLTVEGHGSTITRSTAAGTPTFRIWFASGASDANTTLTLHDLTVSGGNVTGGNVGAGIAGFVAGIRLDKVTVSSNAASGGVANGAGVATIGGTLDVDHSMFLFNSAVNGAGLTTNLTTGTVRRSLFYLNAATSSTGAALLQGSTITFENDTFAGNVAPNGVGGIALIASSGTNSVVNVDSSTLFDNRKTSTVAPANALFAAAGSVIHAHNTIVTDDSTNAAVTASCLGAVTNDAGNLEWPATTCGFGTNANPLLLPLVLGSTGTYGYPLAPASPAIELGGSICPATDQFDTPRPDGALCDSGALEAPEPDTIASGPASDPTNNPQVTFSSPDTPTATFQCKVDAGAYATCTSPYSPNTTDGLHTVTVRAIAPGGYPDRTPATVSFTVDKTAPVVTITSAPPAPPASTGDNTPTIAFTVDDASATTTCKVDSGTAVACASPFTTDPLPDGTHTVVIAATDPVGNTGSKTVTFKVDTVPSQTFNVACGDVAALRAAITSANATLAADTINVTGGPCSFTLHDSVDPAAGGNGLPIVVHPLTVEGNGATIERSTDAGTPNFRIWFVFGTIDPADGLTLHNMVVKGGGLTGNNVGAGVAAYLAALNLDGVTIQANTAAGATANGAGVWTFGGTLAVDHSSFYTNQSAFGAALATTLTPATVQRSTFYLNGGSATQSGATAWVQGSTVTFENDTIAGNVANNGIGGIIASNSGDTSGVVNIVSSTFLNQRKTGVNAPAASLFTYQQAGAGTATIHVADTIVDDISTGSPALAPCTGTIVNDGGNIEWPGNSCGFATHADPKLDFAIALHGGQTYNYRLLPTSPAIDLGGAVCPATDQRDVARPDGDACDAGSYETPAPETVANGPANDPTNNPQVTFSSPDTPNATFQCQVDSGAFATCTSPYSPNTTDGLHTVSVRAVTPDGYVDPSPAMVSFTVDKTAPVVHITSAPASPTNDTTPTITFTVDDPTAAVECQVDGGARVPCTSPFTTDPLPEGMHTIKVYATDPVGNVGSDSVTIGISFGPPNTVIDSGPNANVYNQSSSTFTFHSTKPNSTFECKLDNGAFSPCASPYTVTYGLGTHQFFVRAIDVGGNPDPTPASWTFTSIHCNVLKIVIGPTGSPTVLCL